MTHGANGGRINPFEFELPTRVVFGPGRIAELGDRLAGEGAETVGVIVDGAVADAPPVREATDGLETSVKDHHVFQSDATEPSYEYLDTFRQRIQGPSYDHLVGIGGGSTMDLAKGMATLLRNDGEAITYRGFPDLKHRPVPVTAVPTTAGTGSEVTFNAVFTEEGDTPKERRKLGINSRHNYPVYAIVDPELTLTCPDEVTISAGMDALVHAVESFGAADASAYSCMYSREAFDLLFNELPAVLDDPDEVDRRRPISLGATLAGGALVNAGGGPTGAMSYPLGAAFDVPHGMAGATFLPDVVRYNIERGYEGYADLYDLIDGNDAKLSRGEKSRRFADAIDELVDSLGVPRSLSSFGVKRSDVDFLVHRTATDLGAALEQNPVAMTQSDVRELMEAKR